MAVTRQEMNIAVKIVKDEKERAKKCDDIIQRAAIQQDANAMQRGFCSLFRQISSRFNEPLFNASCVTEDEIEV